ncbi:rod shape-determining protein MreD [candidate division WOR-3 bacterium]|nr:rod shape-determining protein MreD [candidate division WOR-3 bacterium]
MKYVLYLLFIYILLPLNTAADFVLMILFYVTIIENSYFAIICAFIAGLLIDLYYPSLLGFNMLIFLVLVQSLLMVKKYVAQTPITILGLFTVFFLTKITIHHIIIAFDISILYVILTIVFFFPVYGITNQLFYRVWMKT